MAMKRKPDPTINAHAGTDDRASSWDTNPNTGFYAPPSLNSRTMKRWRDNREDDEKIYDKTIHRLFDAQLRLSSAEAPRRDAGSSSSGMVLSPLTPATDNSGYAGDVEEQDDDDCDIPPLPLPAEQDPRQRTLEQFFASSSLSSSMIVPGQVPQQGVPSIDRPSKTENHELELQSQEPHSQPRQH